jgi:tetratricopeptide (TPR) repeat protein
MPTRQRRRVIVDDSALAIGIGARLKAARLKAGLTQQQLAGDRYTKAYVSALEHGHVKPSMAALNFLSTRLGVTAHALFTDETRVWTRLEADLRLAAGRWQEAMDGYESLLQGTDEPRIRAELLRGQAEALVRLDRGAEAAAAGAQAAEIFARLDRAVDAALANYWLAAAQYLLENSHEARALFENLLAQIRGGLAVDPDFKLRVLMALSSVESRAGQHQVALAYLEEVRGLAGQLDDRRRAHFLFDLAHSYRETGDLEAAVRTGRSSLTLFRASEADVAMAALENELALAYLAIGNLGRAEELATSAEQQFTRLEDERRLAHVLETRAAIALAGNDAGSALALVERGLDLARRTGDRKAELSNLLRRAKAQVALGDRDGALASYEEAGELARRDPASPSLRRVLTDWAELLAQAGEVERAYELAREALSG